MLVKYIGIADVIRGNKLCFTKNYCGNWKLFSFVFSATD